MSKRPQKPKPRNSLAATIRSPNSPFRPKAIPNKKKKDPKHKGKLFNE